MLDTSDDVTSLMPDASAATVPPAGSAARHRVGGAVEGRFCFDHRNLLSIEPPDDAHCPIRSPR